jgi:superfamily II DNA or RNA helicase
MKRIELVDDQTLGVTFPYNEHMIEEIKRLGSRRWNSQARRWEVHLSHLMDIVDILHIDPRNLPRQVSRKYQEEWEGVETRLVVGNAMTRVCGSDVPVDEIDEITSFRVEGAEHSAKYKKGEWDGLKHLFRIKGEFQFPTGLLPPVLKVLDNLGKEYELEDQRQAPPPCLELEAGGPSLRDYQKEVLRVALERGKGVLQMATGSGKTVVAAHIIAALSRPTLFFVHTKDLLYQAKGFFRDILGIEVGQAGDGVADIEPVTVATIQTVSRALGSAIKNGRKSSGKEGDGELEVPEERLEVVADAVQRAEAIFFDECHHLPAETCFGIALEAENAYYRFGLSATPYRSDRMDMMIEAAVGPRICKVDCSDLISMEFLVRPTIHLYRVPASPEEKNDTYHRIYQRDVVRNPSRNAHISGLAEEHAEAGRTVLVLVNQVRHGQALAKKIPGSVLLTGKDSGEHRASVLDALREGSQKVVIATTLADEGLDIPGLDVLILAGGGKSETRALQRIGRALRRTEEKTSAIVVDFLDEARFLDDHSQRRLEIYRTESLFDIRIEGAVKPVKEKGRSQRRKVAAG